MGSPHQLDEVMREFGSGCGTSGALPQSKPQSVEACPKSNRLVTASRALIYACEVVRISPHALFVRALAVVGLIVGFLIVPVGVAQADANVDIEKSVVGDHTTVEPGDTFSYLIKVSCLSLQDPCLDMTVTDPIPSEFVITATPQPTNDRDVTVSGNTVTVSYKENVGNNQVGLPAGEAREFEIGVRLPVDTGVADKVFIPNTATVTASNAETKTDTVEVRTDIDAVVTPVTSKSWQPQSAIAGSQADSTVTLGIRNASSSTAQIKQLVVTDDTAATFAKFDLTQLGPITAWPAGADTVVVGVFVNGAWVESAATTDSGPFSVPGGGAIADVTGVRFTFSAADGSVLPNSSSEGTVEIGLKLRDTDRSTGDPIEPTSSETVRNCATPAAVDSDDQTTTGTQKCKKFTIIPSTVKVAPTKDIFPDQNGDYNQDGGIVVGQNSGVSMEMTAKNESAFAVGTLQIVEPSTTSPSDFDKIDVESGRFTWPAQATSATLAVECRSGSNPSDQTFTNNPFSAKTQDITDFGCANGVYPSKISITFAGGTASNPLIESGATAGLDLHGIAARVDADNVTNGLVNCVDATEISGDGSSTSTTTVCDSAEVENPSGGTGNVTKGSKGVNTIVPGQELDYTIRFKNNGNIPLTDVVVFDPLDTDPTSADNPFDAVELVSARATTSNPKSTLFIWDPNAAPAAYIPYATASNAEKARSTGVKIQLDDPLPVGVTFRAEITVILRDPPPAAGTVIRNCFTLQAKADGADLPDKQNCRDVTVVDVPGAATATLGKSIEPANILRPTPGLPDQKMTVKHTLLNDGPLYLSEIGFTDTDTDFFDAVNFVGNIHVNKPPGANRVKVDVCTTDCQTPTWIEGSPTNSTSPSISAGVNPADVNGIRVTFFVNNGKDEILPDDAPPTGGKCPNANVCFDVTARETLKSDGTTAIPDTLADTSNGGFESILGPATFPDVNASVTVTQGDPELKISKTPDSSIGPGYSAPINLKVENNGNWPIKNPTVVDPLDARLTLDRQITGGTLSRPFTITNVQLPSGYDPIPDQNQVQYTETKDSNNRVEKMQWTFGDDGVDDWYLPPGGTFTINFLVKLTPGDVANDTIPNTAAAGGTGFDNANCAAGNGQSSDGTYGVGQFCTDSNQIKTLAGEDVLGAKWSAANDSLGWYNTDTGVFGAVGDISLNCPEPVGFNTGGINYTRFPCVPIVGPGGTIDFLIELENDGTVPATSAVIVDGLPVETDTGVLLTNSQRNTEWSSRPTLAGSVQSSPAATLSYTDTAWPQNALCTKQLTDPTTGICPASAFDDGASAQATGFRAELNFSPNELNPGERAILSYQMSAPLTPGATSDNPLAWNSFGYQATANDGGPDPLLASEPIKAGVAMLQGDIVVTKQVTGSDPGVTLPPFEISYDCTVTPDGGSTTSIASDTVDVAGGASYSLPRLPAGTVCAIWESNSQGGESSNAGRENAKIVTVQPNKDGDATTTVTITNTYSDGELVIKKQESGDGVSLPLANGGILDSGPYPMAVDCVFPAGGNSLPNFPATFELDGNQQKIFTGIPAGSICDVSETDQGRATDVEFSVNGGTPTNQQPFQVEVLKDSEATTEVLIDNRFETNNILLKKSLSGSGSQWAQGPFSFQIDCTLEAGPNAVELQPVTAEISPAESLSKAVGPFPVGAVCKVYETDNGDATGPAPGLIDTVVITPEGTPPVEVDVDNKFPSGRVSVAKVVDGTAADQVAKSEFTLRVKCSRSLVTGGSEKIFDKKVKLKGGQSKAFKKALPIGAKCWATEPKDGGATRTKIDHDSKANAVVITEAASAIDVVATNSFNDAELIVEKRVNGGNPDTVGPFTFAVECTLAKTKVLLPEKDRQFRLAANERRVIAVPKGSTCEVRETDNGGASRVVISDSDSSSKQGSSDGIVTVNKKETVIVTNDFTGGSGGGSGGNTPANTGSQYVMGITWAALLLLGVGVGLIRYRGRKSWWDAPIQL